MPVGGNEQKGRRVGMALYGDLTYDSRVQRQAASLAAAGFEVTIACLTSDGRPAGIPGEVEVRVVRPDRTAVLPGTPSPFLHAAQGRAANVVDRVRWLRDYVRNLRLWGRLVVEDVGPVDVWHLHDLTALAAVVPQVGSEVPVVYDAHELFLETGSARRLPGAARAALRAYERRLIRRSVAVVTVNDWVAAAIRARYGAQRIVTVYNCAPHWTPPAVRPASLRAATGIDGTAPVILYHGALSSGRGVEQLIAAIGQTGLGNVHLALLGFGEMRETYVAASRDASLGDRVHVLDPVPPDELLTWVASADLGVMPIQPTTLNHRLSTPNKLFECMSAGVPVVASDFPAMRAIVLEDEGGPFGLVCDPTSVPAIAAAIRSMLELSPEATAAYRARCLKASSARWSWEAQARALVDLYKGLVDPAGHPEGESITGAESSDPLG